MNTLLTKTPFLIAEIGNNHEGDINAALKMMDAAKNSGADAVKFQAGTAEGFARTVSQIPYYRKYELGRSGYEKILSYSVEIEIPVFFSVWSKEFEDLKTRCTFSKIPVRQLRTIKQEMPYGERRVFERREFVSIPPDMTMTELASFWKAGGIPLHCVPEYPTQDPMLYRIGALNKFFSQRDDYQFQGVGFSDHTVGIRAAIEAVHVWNATVIEKHFTLNHSFGPLRDHALSATPEEFRELRMAV